jgi:transcriptional regulator with XRE-family HTH domain
LYERADDVTKRKGDGAETTGAVFGSLLAIKREDAGLTQEELAALLNVERSTLTKFETGDRVPNVKYVEECDALLRTKGELLRLHRRINWDARLSIFPDWFQRRALMDEKLVELYAYHTLLVPGLLQTEAYAYAVFAREAGVAEESVRESVGGRLSRQSRFLDPDGPLYVALLDESCLRQQVAEPAVMREQLDHLLRVAELPNITIQVVPFGLRHVERPASDLSLITLPAKRRWLYSETLNGAEFSSNYEVIGRHLRNYDWLRAEALSASASAALIREVREGLYDHDHPRSDRRALAQEQLQRHQRRRLRRGGPRIHPGRRPGA